MTDETWKFTDDLSFIDKYDVFLWPSPGLGNECLSVEKSVVFTLILCYFAWAMRLKSRTMCHLFSSKSSSWSADAFCKFSIKQRSQCLFGCLDGREARAVQKRLQRLRVDSVGSNNKQWHIRYIQRQHCSFFKIRKSKVAFYTESENNILLSGDAQLESADIKATLSMSRNKFVYQCSVQGNFYLAR